MFWIFFALSFSVSNLGVFQDLNNMDDHFYVNATERFEKIVTMGNGEYNGSRVERSFFRCTVHVTGQTNFSNCYAFGAGFTLGSGGAIYMSASNLLVSNNVSFEQNRAIVGGAVSCVSTSTFLMGNIIFKNNSAFKQAGALFVCKSEKGLKTELDDPEQEFGSALVEVSLMDTVFSDNFCDEESGANLFAGVDVLNVINCVYSRNSAGSSGGAVVIHKSNGSFYKCKFFNNKCGKEEKMKNYSTNIFKLKETERFSPRRGGGAILLVSLKESISQLDTRECCFSGNTFSQEYSHSESGGYDILLYGNCTYTTTQDLFRLNQDLSFAFRKSFLVNILDYNSQFSNDMTDGLCSGHEEFPTPPLPTSGYIITSISEAPDDNVPTDTAELDPTPMNTIDQIVETPKETIIYILPSINGLTPFPSIPPVQTPGFTPYNTPESTLEFTPHSTLEFTPHSTLDETPHSTFDETPHSTLDETPHSTLDETPHSTLEFTPHSTLDETPHSTLDETPHSTLDETPHSTLDETPHSTLDETPHSTLDETPHSTLDETPHSTLDETPHSTLDETPHSTLDETPHSTLDETPHSTLDETPHSTLDETPHSTLDETPHSTLDETPHSTLDETPHSTLDETPHSTLDETPHSTLEFTPHSTLEFTPHSTLEFTPHSTLEFTPHSTLEFTPHSTLEFTPHSTLEFTPHSTLEFTLHSTLEFTPHSTLEFTPHSTLEFTPHSTLEFTPHSTLEFTPHSTLEFTPHSTLEFTPHSTLEFTPHSTLKYTPESTPILSPLKTPEITLDFTQFESPQQTLYPSPKNTFEATLLNTIVETPIKTLSPSMSQSLRKDQTISLTYIDSQIKFTSETKSNVATVINSSFITNITTLYNSEIIIISIRTYTGIDTSIETIVVQTFNTMSKVQSYAIIGLETTESNDSSLLSIILLVSGVLLLMLISGVLVYFFILKDENSDLSGSSQEMNEESIVVIEESTSLAVTNDNPLWTTSMMGETDDPFRDDFEEDKDDAILRAFGTRV